MQGTEGPRTVGNIFRKLIIERNIHYRNKPAENEVDQTFASSFVILHSKYFERMSQLTKSIEDSCTDPHVFRAPQRRMVH